jgi:hypothetical protein
MTLSQLVCASLVASAVLALSANGAIAAPPIIDNSNNGPNGVAKGQMSEGVAPAPTGGTTGDYMRKKLPGKMQSGTLTTTAPAPNTSNPSHGMIGNHKDVMQKQQQ